MISSGSTFYVSNGVFVTCDKVMIKLSACLICGGFVTKWRNLTSKVCLCLIFAGEKMWITYHVDFPHIFYQTADKCQELTKCCNFSGVPWHSSPVSPRLHHHHHHHDHHDQDDPYLDVPHLPGSLLLLLPGAAPVPAPPAVLQVALQKIEDD